MKHLLSLVLLVSMGLFSFVWIMSDDLRGANEENIHISLPTKPYTRWWWFATEIKKEDLRHQLDWFKQMNFGGVEIAWVYPLYRYQQMYAQKYGRHYPKDTTAQQWLSPAWSEMVTYTKQYADSIGLRCDFTFGSAWPVAGSNIDRAHRTQIYGDSSFQQLLTFAWTWPDTQYVINHLDSHAFKLFAQPVGDALSEALKGTASSLFTDSWEIKLNAKNKIWTHGFEQRFKDRFGYDILPFMQAGLDSFPDVRYDYMMLMHDYVLEGFYKPFVRQCHELGALSRVQCLSSPTDVMTTYSLVDIPETEAMLNNPNYSRIVSSAACLSSKPIVSSETFTCMYGFPATYLRQEQTADLKLVADALFAQGVNHHVYHGSPYNPAGSDTIDFFATTYFGPGGSLEAELPSFNAYISKVSSYMRRGLSYSDIAVYIPYEDAVMKGAYPSERQRVWVWGEYEMRYINPPQEVEGYHPVWINRHFLEQAKVKEERLVVGDASFSMLYVDVDYLDGEALSRIFELASAGLPVCIKKAPKEPGWNKSKDYMSKLRSLYALPNVTEDLSKVLKHAPLVQGDSLPDYWCRREADGSLLIFFAQPKAKGLSYPLYSGQSFMEKSVFRELTFNVRGKSFRRKIAFNPYQSVLLHIEPHGKIKNIDITFIPKDPVIRPREPQKMYF